MAIYFSEPKEKRDWPAIGMHLGLAALEGFALNIPNVIRELNQAGTQTLKEQSSDERAWVWLYTTLSAALYLLYQELPEEKRISSQNAKEKIKEFSRDVLNLKRRIEMHPHDASNPLDSEVMSVARTRFPELFSELLQSKKSSSDTETIRFGIALRAASARVFALDPEYYGLLDSVLDSAMTDGERRDRSWARHATWIRSLFERAPIFSSEENQEFPLSLVYQPLRCCWHEEIEKKTDEDSSGTRHAERVKTEILVHVDEIHSVLHKWLEDESASSLRIVSGGPGSGKSSFSRAFSSEVSDRSRYRVVFVELQNLGFESADLERSLGLYLTSSARNNDFSENGSAGFPQNPLEWRMDSSDPILLVFDGLDELSASENKASELSRLFVQKVSAYLTSANSYPGPSVRAIVLGRSAACVDGMKLAALPTQSMVHIAPLKPLEEPTDFALSISDQHYVVRDPRSLCKRDQRIDYWERWAKLTGTANAAVPQAITSEDLGELNVEPLLLHLLILSGYTGDNWKEAINNRNRVYREIFSKVLARNEKKKEGLERSMSVADAFSALECLGIAAWRGAGRTGDNEEFKRLLSLYNFSLSTRLEASDLLSQRYVAVQFHTRQGTSTGYEFIHKSFSEYLTARALISIGKRSARALSRDEDPDSPEKVAKLWIELIRNAEMSPEIVRFLIDEARLELDQNHSKFTQNSLASLFSWVQRNGMPSHENYGGSFREMESVQRCGESALLSVLSAVSRSLLPQNQVDWAELPNVVANIDWPTADQSILLSDNSDQLRHTRRKGNDAPRMLCQRVFNNWRGIGAKSSFSALSLKNAQFGYFDLTEVNFEGSDLERAIFAGAALDSTNFSRANLEGANFFRAWLRAANFSDANLADANFSDAHLESASFHGAQLMGADFQDQDISEANFSETNLSGANLRGAKFEETKFKGANFTDANLDGAKFIASDLEQCIGLTDEQLSKVSSPI